MFAIAAVLLLAAQAASAFHGAPPANAPSFHGGRPLSANAEGGEGERRAFLSRATGLVLGGAGLAGLTAPIPADASVYLDPAMYGDQELRVAAVYSLREAVRRTILQNPSLAPAFYELAMLDSLSFNPQTKAGGPDGRVISNVLGSKDTSQHTKDLQEAANALIAACIKLKKYTAITIADAVALGGVEAVNSVGGPELSVQLGRMEAPKNSNPSPIPIDLLATDADPARAAAAFRLSGLTERETTALLGCLLTLQMTQKGRASKDWKASTRGKFIEPGKIGRMSDFKPLTDEDIAEMADEGSEYTDNEDWYIAESFGSRDQVFGQSVADELTTKNFNKYLGDLNQFTAKKGGKGDVSRFGWIGKYMLDPENPQPSTWLNKYGSSNLSYAKDLNIAYNSVTQLGAEYTGGKYEALLKNKPRRTLNDE